MNIITRKTCRVCDSAKLSEVFSLGDHYISNFVENKQEGIKAPLDLIYCENCTLLQLRHTAPQELMYTGFYWYRSGVTDTMKKALRDITSTVEKMTSLQSGDVVLDIGANDGTLLETYRIDGLKRVGCEPANNLTKELAKVTDYVMHDFWVHESYEKLGKKMGFGKAKVITAIGMFYDMEDPNQFILDVQKCLTEDGVFVAQLMCLASMLKTNDLGNICHEHLEYYSLESLRYLFEKNGLEIFKVEENDVNGGSYRLYARHHKGTGIHFNERLTTKDYLDFFDRVNFNRDKCVDFIKQEVSRGKKVYVYGASTKGNTILQHYGLDNTLITAAAERSPEKWGKYTVGTNIPIVSEEEARAARPDYFLVLPWAFFNEFYKRESAWRGQGGQFILPLPEFKIVA